MAMAKERSDTSQAPKKSGIHFEKAEDFFVEYANNTVLEPSLWDLKIRFGELDQSLGDNVVVQKFATVLSWPQVKVFWYFLTMHLLGYEARNGRIVIPSGIIGDIGKVPLTGVSEDEWRAIYEHNQRFMNDNPEARPAAKDK